MSKNKNTVIRIMILDKLLNDQYHEYSLDDLTEEVNNELSHSGLEDSSLKETSDTKYFGLKKYILI